MRVLYLCHRIPYPPNKGEKIRAFHQLQGIGARHEVDLFTLIDDPADVEHRPALMPYCRTVTVARRSNSRIARLQTLPFLLTRKPLTLPYFYSAELDREVRKSLASRSYDRIFVYCSAMAQYVERVDRIPVVVDLVDVDSDKWRQYAAHSRFPFSLVYRREANRLREYEQDVCRRAASVLVTTEREARLVSQIWHGANVHVVPVGVDADYFTPLQVQAASPAAPTVIFTGDMSYLPNEQAVSYFARQVLPIVRKTLPDVRFLIVGRNPTATVQRLQEIDGVEVTGAVPDIRTYLAKAHIAVAPFLIAAGIQNKILEALAYGLPVVATTRVLQGLSQNVSEVIECGDCADSLAAKVVHLLEDPEFARHKGLEGRARVTADYNWSQCVDQVLQLIDNPVKKPTPHARVHSGPV